MSLYLTPAMAKQAISLALPSITAAMDTGVAKRHDLFIVISTRSLNGDRWNYIASHACGDINNWEYSYDAVATSKDEISRRTGLSSREVQTMHPELLEPDDTIYYGNAIRNNIIVSCSGVQAWFDEVFANIVLQFCLGLIQSKLEDQKASGCTEFED